MVTRGWFHANISGVEAEELLKERGSEGSFLVRPSQSSPGNYSLSARQKAGITHIRIQNTGDYYDLFGGEQFPTLAELVQFYTENDGSLKEKNGDVIEMKYALHTDEPAKERWYHGNMNGIEAEKLLKEKGKPGSFLVRDSNRHPGEFVLSVNDEGNVTHVRIRHTEDDKYDVGGGKKLDNLSELVDYYRSEPITLTMGADIRLKQPFNATRIYASGIKNRILELEKAIGSGTKLKTGFCEEFELLQQSEGRHLHSRDEGRKAVNRLKNRYKNILPFDYTRIILKDADPREPGSDYINANAISIPGSKCYIATQGCLKDTIKDFWRMIWQEKASIILLATKLVEKSKSKCARYWPETKDGQEFSTFHGKLIVKPITESKLNDYILREFEITLEGSTEVRTIFQYHFMDWPDHGVPKDTGQVLSMLQDINDKHELLRELGPIVVQCSAGIGRTGTLIVISLMINEIKQSYGIDYEINIQETILLVREQRSGMIQTEDQYRLVYLAVTQFIETISTRAQAGKESADADREYSNMAFPGAEAERGKAQPPLITRRREAAKPPLLDNNIYENVASSQDNTTSPATKTKKAQRAPPNKK